MAPVTNMKKHVWSGGGKALFYWTSVWTSESEQIDISLVNYDNWQLESSFGLIENKEMWGVWHFECCGAIHTYYTKIHNDQ